MHRLVERALFDMGQARAELLRELARITEADWERYVPYGVWTLKDLLAHVAAFDGVWSMTTRSLLTPDGVTPEPIPDIDTVHRTVVTRARGRSVDSLIEELHRRRRLLIGYVELLEERHLAMVVPGAPAGEDNVRAHIWVGYHDRQHAADIRRALTMAWKPERLAFAPAVQAAVSALSPDPALRVLYSVAPDAWSSPSPVPGWTYHDVLAHLAIADRVLQWHLRAALMAGRVEPRVAIDDELRRLVDERRDVGEDRLIEEFVAARHETLRLFSQLRPEHARTSVRCGCGEPDGERSLLECVRRCSQREARHLAALRTAMRWRRG